MTTSLKTAAVVALALAALGGNAVAQTVATTPAQKAATTTTAKKAAPAKVKAKQTSAAVRSELSKKCSADADAKKLHGKERKAFRKTCMKKPS